MDFATLTDSGELAQEIDKAAADVEPAAREMLGALAGDLEHARNLDRWAEIDLADALARPENFAVPRAAAAGRRWPNGAHWERIAEAFLSCLVFVPLLITWTGLFEASKAYARLADTDKSQATRPFLQLWESGFDGQLPSWFRFGDMALAAVVFISILLVLALLHSAGHYRAQRAEEGEQAERERLSAALAALLTRAQLHLTEFRLTSPARFTASLTDAADALRELILDARQAQASVTSVLAEAQHISESLDNAAEKMNGATDVIGEVSTRVRQVLEESTETLTDLQRTSAQGLRKILDDGLEALRDGQRATLDAVAASQRAGTDAADSVRRAAEAAVAAATDATRDAAARNESALRGVQDRVEQGTGRVELALRDLSEVQQQLSDRSAALTEAVGGIVGSFEDTNRQTSESARVVLQRANVALDELHNSVEGWYDAAAHWVGAARVVEQRMSGGSGSVLGPASDRRRVPARAGASASAGLGAVGTVTTMFDTADAADAAGERERNTGAGSAGSTAEGDVW